jgi:hypothetical protein
MTPEPVLSSQPDGSPGRPFPWRCPRCGRKEVNRAVISYQCQRLHNGQPVSVTISDLAVPKCGHCGELVFDYLAEQQIDRAFQEQITPVQVRRLSFSEKSRSNY